MTRFTSNTLALIAMIAILSSCGQKKHSTQHSLTDSLSLWQWDEVILTHEKLDTLSGKPRERTTLIHRREITQEQKSTSDSTSELERAINRKLPSALKHKHPMQIRALIVLVSVVLILFGLIFWRLYRRK